MSKKHRIQVVEDSIFDSWKKNQRHGDIEEIHKQTKISVPVLSRALNHKLASQPVKQAISNYFNV